MNFSSADFEIIRDILAENSIPEPNSGCHLWLGYAPGFGHGRIKYRGKMIYAHRAAWLCRHGDIAAPCVLHRCDVPGCVNPDHLFLGTRSDNDRDMRTKGRQSGGRGQKVWTAKLDEAAVYAIRADLRSRRIIAAEFRIDRSVVDRIKRRASWVHLPD
ncbi:MAG: HNH endonuclease [Alphaproteobacteria bacterium]|nr:HNH endonuclease [Alphaproteobacteria bacterium]MCW5739682.1 HNH endonuclease [Alphaproteobacteria bacterium]